MTKINSATIKYWHTTTLKNGVGEYKIPTINGVELTELRRHQDGKTFVYHVPADEVENCEAALNELFNVEE